MYFVGKFMWFFPSLERDSSNGYSTQELAEGTKSVHIDDKAKGKKWTVFWIIFISYGIQGSQKSGKNLQNLEKSEN